MLAEWLILFIIITFICLILSIFLMEENPILAIPVIMIGMIFSVLCAYGVFDVDYVYIAYNSTVGNSTPYVYSVEYGSPYTYVFFLIFMIFCMLFFKTGWNLVQIAAKTKGEMEYKKRGRRR